MTTVTGIELAAKLIVQIGYRTVTVIAPDYASMIPVEITGVKILDGAYIPDGAIVSRGEIGVLISDPE
jgi:hypothetical protein